MIASQSETSAFPLGCSSPFGLFFSYQSCASLRRYKAKRISDILQLPQAAVTAHVFIDNKVCLLDVLP